MERVIATDPSGRWGTAARARLDQWAFSRGNATTGPRSPSAPSPTATWCCAGRASTCRRTSPINADWRTIWNANAGYEFVNTPDWGAGRGAELHRNRGSTRSADFSYDYLVGIDLGRPPSSPRSCRRTCRATTPTAGSTATSWVSEVAATPALDYTWAPNNYTRLFGRFSLGQLLLHAGRAAPPGTRPAIPRPDPLTQSQARNLQSETQNYRNRDGRGEQAGFEQGFPLMAINTQLTGAAIYTPLPRAGRRVLVPRRRGLAVERDAAPMATHAAAAGRVHVPRLPEQHEPSRRTRRSVRRRTARTAATRSPTPRSRSSDPIY